MKKADLNEDGAYDERELTKVMFDMTDMMIKKIFDWNLPLSRRWTHIFLFYMCHHNCSKNNVLRI